MPKFYRRKRYTSSRDKYSIENKGGVIQTATSATGGWYQNTVNIVPPTAVEGMRKVKHTTVTLVYRSGGAGDEAGAVCYALVYVPEGYNPNTLFTSTSSVYEPNQFVMQSGIMDFSAGPIRISSPVSRNLNSGDSIWLVVGSQTAGLSLNYFTKYAITLQ